MLACARIGAVHSVVFGGFAAEAVRDRMNDAQAKCVITQDGAFRSGIASPLKPQVDKALEHCPSVQARDRAAARASNPIEMKPGRDHDWHELMQKAAAPTHEAPALDAEHPLFILYTSGSTGKPKGVLHTHRAATCSARTSPATTCSICKPEDTLLVHRRRRLGHRPQLHRVRTACERRDRGDVRRRAEPSRPGSLLVDHRAARRDDLLHGADRGAHVREVGRRVGRSSTTCRRCACSARSASRSTPRLGCGTAKRSAATAARSSTRIGRPRPDRSR